MVGLAVCSAPAYATFPSVNLNITSASGCLFGPGLLSASGDAPSAVAAGADITITAPSGGPLTISISFVKFGTTKVAFTSFGFSDTVNSGSGTGTGFATGDQTNVTGFDVMGSTSGTCSFAFTASVSSGSESSGVTADSSSNIITRSDTVNQTTTSGPFVDASNAASFAVTAALGDAQQALTFQRGRAGFSSRGLPAGEWGLPIGVWGNVGYTDSDNDFVSTASSTKRWHGTLGADTSITDWLIVGMGAGYENNDADTTFNSGNSDTKGFTIVTYLGAVISDSLSADFAYGRSFLDTDQFRTAAGTQITSSFEGDRRFAAGNLNYARSFGDWRVSGRGGLFWVGDTQDAFVESNGTPIAESRYKIGRARLGGEVARAYGSFEPYVSATYNLSFEETDTVFGAGVADPGSDNDDILVGVGARYFGDDSLSGSFEFSTLLGRDNVDEYSINVLIRSDF